MKNLEKGLLRDNKPKLDKSMSQQEIERFIDNLKDEADFNNFMEDYNEVFVKTRALDPFVAIALQSKITQKQLELLK